MKKDNTTTTINGQSYDNVTGLPVAETPAKRATNSAQKLHGSTSRSTTLRRAVKRSGTQQPGNDIMPRKRPAASAAATATHPSVKKFTAPAATKSAPVAATAKKPATAASTDLAARKHPHAVKATAQKIAGVKKTLVRRQPVRKPIATQPKVQPAKRQATPSAKDIKNTEITKALATAAPAEVKRKAPSKMSRRLRTKAARWWTGIVAGLIIIGVIVWVNLPGISLSIAAAQADVPARSPQFTPDGYSLQLPITASDNQVKMTFASSQNNTEYSLTQEKSLWDSEAVRSHVETISNGQFLTTNDRGLTIYTFDGSAAWVNKGILYQISGDSNIDRDTILRIASSL